MDLPNQRRTGIEVPRTTDFERLAGRRRDSHANRSFLRVPPFRVTPYKPRPCGRTGSTSSATGAPPVTPKSAASSCRRIPMCIRASGPPTAILPSFPTPIGSISAAIPTGTSPSAVAFTPALEIRWRAWKRKPLPHSAVSIAVKPRKGRFRSQLLSRVQPLGQRSDRRHPRCRLKSAPSDQ